MRGSGGRKLDSGPALDLTWRSRSSALLAPRRIVASYVGRGHTTNIVFARRNTARRNAVMRNTEGIAVSRDLAAGSARSSPMYTESLIDAVARRF